MGKRTLTSRAVFLDRDGVLNANVWNATTQAFESPRTPEEFTLNAGVTDALAALHAAGFKLILVSNQPNVAKRKATMETLAAIHDQLTAGLAAAGVTLDDVNYCYHHPDGIEPSLSGPCTCRKPSPYFLLQAQEKFDLDLGGSWMVGDRDSDIACGASAGTRTIFVESQGSKPPKPGAIQPDFKTADLRGAARIILAG